MEYSALWTFDQDGGITAIDSSGNGFNATLVGPHATWTKDARVGGGALNLSDSSYAEAAGPVVDTSRSFTVAAWVKLSAIDKTRCQTILGIDGTKVSAFFLQLNHEAGDRFVFHRRETDDDNYPLPKSLWARSNFVPVQNKWYHLTGVYDADAKTISLYVNGQPQESVPFNSPWQGTGKTSIGRGWFARANSDFLNGTVDDVRFYAFALTAKQIQILASK
jgi:alpha-N-arabinofuranosidase